MATRAKTQQEEQENLYTLREGDPALETGEKQYVLKIGDLPTEEKPREKLLRYGPSFLSAAELFALILNTGTKKEDVLSMSTRLLKEYGEKALLHQTDPKKITEMLDIPLIKACQLVACFEIGRRFFEETSTRPIMLRTAKQVYVYLSDMRELPKEHLRGLYLNSRYQLIHDEVISIGSLTMNIVHPREVFKPALEYSASAVILAHNHPSGSIKPSETDKACTQQIIEAGKILGINLLDHIIVTKSRFASIPATYNV